MSEQATDPVTEARSMGWVPAEEFRGDQAKWVDAETFVDRGKQFMPILRKNNERLKADYQRLEQEVVGLKSLLNNSKEAIEELKAFHSEDTKAKVAAVKQQLLDQLKIAKQDNDVDAETRLTDELIDLKAAEKATAKPAAAPKPTIPADPPVDPALAAWMAEPRNAWFGEDKKKTRMALVIAQELRDDPENKLSGRAFFDKVAEEVEETLGNARSTPASKVEGSRGGAGGSGDRGNTYADLPADAKAQCEADARKLVGDGRAFKDIGAWRAYFTKTYFE